jgi:hypothetical protein
MLYLLRLVGEELAHGQGVKMGYHLQRRETRSLYRCRLGDFLSRMSDVFSSLGFVGSVEFQIFAVPSAPPVASRLPSGLKQTPVTVSV